MASDETNHSEANPLQKVDRIYNELVAHYGSAPNRELRAASKLLLVALEKFRVYGGADWIQLVGEYLALVDQNPDKFKRILISQRPSGSSQAAP